MNTIPRVKICGITNLEDGLICLNAGADAVGFNFYRNSPRFVEPASAVRIAESLGRRISKVGVFVNASVEEIMQVLGEVELDAVQLHGDETNDFVKTMIENCRVEVIKAVRVGPEYDIELVRRIPAESILLDAYSRTGLGGTGETFDWKKAAEVRDFIPRLYLAGGLTALNVAPAVALVGPFAVDACSGLESEPGIKNKQSVFEFVRNAKHGDHNE